ncbi:MAG: hypothetical protein ABFC34_08585 [Methanobacterium sp.]
MEIKKNGFLWAKVDGDSVNVKLPPEFLEDLNSEDEVLILTKKNWKKIWTETNRLPTYFKDFGCGICGGKPKYKVKDGEDILGVLIPLLCAECFEKISVTPTIESNPCFEEIPEPEKMLESEKNKV